MDRVLSNGHCNTEYSDVKIGYCFPHYGQKSDKILIDIINSAERTLDIAIFNFMDKDILNAVLDAMKRDVAVRIITDKKMVFNPLQYRVLKKIKLAGGLIKVNSHPGFMHQKISNIDKKILAVGSANYTKSAQMKNDEIFMVFYDKRVAVDYYNQFELMWNKKRDFRKF